MCVNTIIHLEGVILRFTFLYNLLVRIWIHSDTILAPLVHVRFSCLYHIHEGPIGCWMVQNNECATELRATL